MDSFVAIDFETANAQRCSICSVGLVVVKDGEIVDRIYRLIRPEPEEYSYWNVQVHGLTEADTADAPVFSEVWAEIENLLPEGLPFVAHNKSFDEGCLKVAFRAYGMDYPDYEFYCTCVQSRRVFKHLPDHKLPTVAEYCGYSLEDHHHALADAEACAQIALVVFGN